MKLLRHGEATLRDERIHVTIRITQIFKRISTSEAFIGEIVENLTRHPKMKDLRREIGSLNKILRYAGGANPNGALNGGALIATLTAPSTDDRVVRSAHRNTDLGRDTCFSIDDQSRGVVA